MTIEIKEFINVEAIEEAIRFKEEEAIFVAGATAIGRARNLKAKKMVNLLTLPLNYIEKQDNIISIGATTTLDDIETSPAIKEHLPVLAETLKHVAAWGIKTMATIGGSVAISFPWSDITTTLLCLNSSVIIHTKNGREELPLEEFTKNRINLLKKCIIEEIKIEIPQNIDKWDFKKVAETSFDTAILNMTYIKKGKGIHVAVGARPRQAKRLKSFERTRNIEDGIEEAELKDDVRASRWWRKEVLKAWLKEIIQ